jgi:hypothetical protein
MSQVITHYSGNSFIATCQLLSDLSTGIDLTTVTITSQIRDTDGSLVSDCVITKSNQTTNPGDFTVEVSDTSTWPSGKLHWDIRYIISGQTVNTDRMEILCKVPVTQV